MTKTRAQLRDTIRQQIGDDVRLSGNATSGSKITLVDTERLIQADNYWNGQKVYIQDTYDAVNTAPIGEVRKVASFNGAINELTFENPFSDNVDSGDKYQICIWPDTLYDQIITSAIAAYSRYRPYKTNDTFSISPNARRYDPPTGLDLKAGHRIDEIRYINANTQEDYAIYGWMIDPYKNKIDIGYYASETKTLTIYYSKSHDDFSDDDDTITVSDDDEEFIIKWIRAQFWLLMSKEDFDEFGNLRAGSWTRGQISENTGTSRKAMLDLYRQEMQEWESQIKQQGFLLSGENKKGDANVWVAPRDYRVRDDYELY
jgi:hypothetical protein